MVKSLFSTYVAWCQSNFIAFNHCNVFTVSNNKFSLPQDDRDSLGYKVKIIKREKKYISTQYSQATVYSPLCITNKSI